MKRSAKRLEAMTLVEIMVATAIISVIAVLVYSAIGQTVRTKQRVEAQTDRIQAITAALERMTREMSMAYVSAQFNSNPALVVVRTCFVGQDRGSGDRLDFTSFSHQRLYRDAHESDQNELSYFLATNPDRDHGGRRVLARREQSRIDDDPQHGGEIVVALEDVEEFDLSYLDPMTMEWVTSWDSTQYTGQMNRMPAQVKIVMRVGVGEGQQRHLQTFGTRAQVPIRYGLNFAIYLP
jgi:general secretion pathway protein J